MDPIVAQAQLEQLKFVLIIAGAMITILNGGVVYFLKSIHKDFKTSQLEQADQRERLAVLEFRVSDLDGKPVRHPAPSRRNTNGD